MADVGPIPSKADTIQLHHDADLTSTGADIRALAQTEWVTRIGSLVQDWFMPSRPDAGHSSRVRIAFGRRRRRTSSPSAREGSGEFLAKPSFHFHGCAAKSARQRA